MKTTWVFLLTVGIVSADVGLGYHYKVPQTSYGTPSYQYNDNNGQYNSAFASSLGSGSFYKGGSGYQNGGVSSSGLGNEYYQSSTGSSNIVKPINYFSGSSGASNGFQTQYSSSSQFQSSAQEKYQHSYQIQQQPPVVYKHFYVHAAPEEPELPKSHTPIVLPPAQKHYKIIFVKVPSEGHRSQAVIPVQPQNEEKTIVYVLVKKPEDHHELIVPKIEQKPPSKPEVFFIKYKNKEDSQAVIDNIVKDYNKGQNVVTTNLGGASGNNYNTVSGAGDSSFNSASSFGNVQYDAPIQSDVSDNTQSFQLDGNQGSSFSLSSASGGGVESNDGNVVSSSHHSSVAPITISSTGSSVDYDGASAISTSQGVPYETYGPPKFRID
ncbi:unnamed protein product [Arctia plantaginis]|uniref:DUF243 domain-containing protein n=1 Tax=Arctia plantaginis TaxID=874455 RepID=A0A8S0YYY2_ARCPL|nr:unnamed protein product [Arctia plantaginis]